MKISVALFWSLLLNGWLFAQHPITCITQKEVAELKTNLNTNSLFQQSFHSIQEQVDLWLDKDVDVPTPKDPAGGYTHDKHKLNYTLMYNSALLYQLTGKEHYALLVKKMLLKYALLNPTLTKHPQGNSGFPGKLFWQALNDANWLVYVGMAFDCIYYYLTTEERKLIANGAFKPEVEYLTKDLKNWFNLIHNQAVWGCAGVGIVGMATDNPTYVSMALLGTNLDGKSGFLAHIDSMFSPDGFYTEGPYYARYALLPFYVFANAINNFAPEKKIFYRRNKVLKKALNSTLQLTDLKGRFYSLNDALKEKDFTTNELVEAVNIAWKVYGNEENLLPVAKMQQRTTLSLGGLSLAKALNVNKAIPSFFPYESIELTDGNAGNEGGLSVLRSGQGNNLVSLIYKYTAHGLSHGHYDKLNIQLFDGNEEILQDYGAVRFIGIEQKNGGRYLPETKSYAEQTIAHNTVVVDEQSHFNGVEASSEQYHPTKRFSSIGNHAVQVVSAEEENSYKGVGLQRTIYLLQLPNHSKPLLVDLFKIQSKDTHQYDLPFQYLGTLMNTNYKYLSNNSEQHLLGKANGYQHLWKEAEATPAIPMAQFTFLNKNTFYTISSLLNDSDKVFFTRLGANDPSFNCRRDPAYILRRKEKQTTFINAIEIHGNYDTNLEIASNAYSSIQKIQLLRDDSAYLVSKLMIDSKELLIIQFNDSIGKMANHSLKLENQRIDFVGPYTIIFDNKTLN